MGWCFIKLQDVNKEGKTRAEIKALRMIKWKRPRLIKDREALRDERIKEAGYVSDIREQDKG